MRKMRNENSFLPDSNTIPKSFFGYMRSKQTVRDNVTTLRKDEELTKMDQETADMSATYFKQVFTVEDVANMPVVTERDFGCQDSEMKFDEKTVLAKLQKLNPDKSPGPDDIHMLLIKECATVLAEPLSFLFQQSFDSGTLPTDSKTANIVTIFKKDRANRANYRPVSLTSMPCKIMEAIIKEKLMAFLRDKALTEQGTTWFP